MTATNRWSTLFALIIGVSLIVLDGTIVAVSQPVIISDLGLTLTEAQWVSSIYTVVFAALLLPLGSLADRVGRKRMCIIGLIAFAVASLIAALSTTGPTLIAGRALQGIGGAMVLPTTLSTINAVFRGKDRAMAFGLWGAAMASMAAIGPLLGGWITTSFSWPWIFFVNLPVVLIVVLWAWRAVPESRAEHVQKVDLGGVVLAALALGLIVFGLIEATTYGWFEPKTRPVLLGVTRPSFISVTAVALILGVLLLVAFVVDQARRVRAGKHALLDVTLFAIPSFARGNIAAMTVATGEFGILFALPLFLVNVLGLTTMQSGWVLASLAGGAILSGGLARHLAAALGAGWTVVIGLGLEVLGIGVAAALVSPGVAVWLLALTLAVYGFGMGLASAQLASVILAQVPVERSGMTSAAQSTFRQVGSAIGVAIAGTVLASVMSHDLPDRLRAAHVPAVAIDKMVDVAIDSAGNAMTGLARGDQSVLDALHQGFSFGMTGVLVASGAFLLVGFIASVMLARVAGRMES